MPLAASVTSGPRRWPRFACSDLQVLTSTFLNCYQKSKNLRRIDKLQFYHKQQSRSPSANRIISRRIDIASDEIFQILNIVSISKNFKTKPPNVLRPVRFREIRRGWSNGVIPPI
ncbi:hypothetical protein CEXT_389171 [Caerostris extrusa]|uniref:Uncharacterized protein n=1 Tax=Caerostris extrusa TaxID=172846 RepID=A0AAV4T861_CAEEX|nr:hypothetical protein CEXT_389171 [Caerostris extrusa]